MDPNIMKIFPGINMQEIIGARVFFYDLISCWTALPTQTMTHGCLITTPEEVKAQTLVDLMESLWTRTINTGGKRRALDKARQETLLVENEMGGELVTYSYRAIESKTPFLNNNPVSPQAYGFNSSYMWRKPPPEICNLARNSYALSCFNDDRAREIGGVYLSQPILYSFGAGLNNNWRSAVVEWYGIAKARGAIAINSFVPDATGAWGHPGPFHVAETTWEWEHFLSSQSNKTPRVRQVLDDDRRRERRSRSPLRRINRDEERTEDEGSTGNGIRSQREHGDNDYQSQEGDDNIYVPGADNSIPPCSLQYFNMLELEFLTRPNHSVKEAEQAQRMLQNLSTAEKIELAVAAANRRKSDPPKLGLMASSTDVRKAVTEAYTDARGGQTSRDYLSLAQTPHGRLANPTDSRNEAKTEVKTPRTPAKDRLGSRAEPFVADVPQSGGVEVTRMHKQAEIKLLELKGSSISSWGKLVLDFESQFGPYNRRLIDPDIKTLISDRWNDSLYTECIPRDIPPDLMTRDSWIDRDVISTRDLIEFLTRSARLGRGNSSFGSMRYQEFILWVGSRIITFTRENLRDSYERFRIDLRKKTEILADEDLSVEDHKECCKALHGVITRSEYKAAMDKNIDQEILNHFILALKGDPLNSISDTFDMMNEGYSSAMKNVVIDPLRNKDLFTQRPPSLKAIPLPKEKESSSKSKDPQTSKPKESSSSSKHSKKDKSSRSRSPETPRRSRSPETPRKSSVRFEDSSGKKESK